MKTLFAFWKPSETILFSVKKKPNLKESMRLLFTFRLLVLLLVTFASHRPLGSAESQLSGFFLSDGNWHIVSRPVFSCLF